MDRSLIQQLEKNEEEGKKEDVMGVPVCGGNLSTPVFDISNYFEQVHYKIGTRLYIEMQIRDNWKQAEDKRDLELENII